MAATNDTIDGLLAEFRGYSAGMPPSYHVTMSWADFRRMLDRFDAAHKCECGNAAKLREAIAKCVNLITEFGNAEIVKTSLDVIIDIEAILNAALAAPPRNCDVGTAEEQSERFAKFCHANINTQRCCGDCPAFRTTRDDCELVWAQMPYEEGGAK